MKLDSKTGLKANMDLVTFVVSALALVTALFSCAPTIEEKKKSLTAVASSSHFHDKDLSFNNPNAFADTDFSSKRLDQNTTSRQKLELIENQFLISRLTNSDDWQKKASDNFSQFNAGHNFMELKVQDSVYLDIVYNQIASTVTSGVTTADAQLQKDVQLVATTVLAEQQNNFKITAESTFAEKLQQTSQFIDLITAKIQNLDIMPEFKTLFVEQMKLKSADLILKANNLNTGLVKSQDLQQAVGFIDAYVTDSKSVLLPEDLKSLENGRKLAKMITGITDGTRGLAALAMVWSILEPQQRTEMIKPENADFYNFLVTKGERDINCLIERNCESFVTKIKLNIGVYPALEKYGVASLKTTLNQKSLDFIKAKVNQMAFNSLKVLSDTIVTEVTASVEAKRLELKTFDTNLSSVLKTNLSNYLQSHAVTKMNSFLISDSGNGKADLTDQGFMIRNKLNTLNTMTETKELTKNQLEILELSLRLPEFSQSADAAAANPLAQADLVQLLLEPKTRKFIQNENDSASTKLNDQTAALLTTAKVIRELTDWKTTSFDENLSKIQASEIITEFKTAELNKPFFNKADLLALVLSVSSETLKFLEDEKSPLVLIDNHQKIILIKDFTAESGAVALAAASDFNLQERSNIVKAQDLSRFQLALIELYTATEGLEKSTSSVLRDEAGGKVSLMNQMLAARKKIRTLVVSIGNFLSNQMIQSNGLIQSEVLLPSNLLVSKTVSNNLPQFNLMDQAVAVEALVRTYEMTDIDVYLWSAQDIYYSMNQQLFDRNLKFYKNNLNELSTEDRNTEKVSITNLASCFKSLLFLKPYLSGDSQNQFDSIFEGWISNI